jgi:hypothetical protein
MPLDAPVTIATRCANAMLLPRCATLAVRPAYRIASAFGSELPQSRSQDARDVQY